MSKPEAIASLGKPSPAQDQAQDHAQEQRTTSSFSSFKGIFQERADRTSPFCLGIDPSDEVLAGASLEDFCARLSEKILKEKVALVKLQSAYFERFGARGSVVLERLIFDLRKEEVLVLLDVKRGDIATTNEAYAQAFFGESSTMYVDGMTAQAYMGFEELSPLFKAAEQRGGLVFVVAASSNASGRDLQSAKIGGRTLVEFLAEQIAQCESAGAVVGATRDDLSTELLARFGDSLLLCPGIGAQGADFSVFARFPNKELIIPTASRSILCASNFIEALKRVKELSFESLR